MKKYGEQPAKQYIREYGASVARVAVEIGVTHPHLNAAVNGMIRPSEQVRERLPKLLGKSLDELFTPDSIGGGVGFGRGAQPQGWAYLRGGWRSFIQLPEPDGSEGRPFKIKISLYAPGGMTFEGEILLDQLKRIGDDGGASTIGT